MSNQSQNITQTLLHFLAGFAATSMVVKTAVSENLNHAGDPGELRRSLHNLIRAEVVSKYNVPDPTFLFEVGDIISNFVSQLSELQAGQFSSARKLEETIEGIRQEAVDKMVAVVETTIVRLDSLK